ncbi:troponin C, slow skeletal and cardiac muscles-like [Ruditapes philippinarum]|uniref:troponin C, slow skeletal and cardiac muscles-like n=1 Tax=Ruditapes philippinarum TaxID=129788 RepID=UPI00295B4F68|nr:troponin C, slow skeletal and cardiac muscles-like [Ruditapes philippinarum]
MDVRELTEEQKREIKSVYDSQVKNGCPGLSQKQTRSALLRLGIKPASFDIEKFWFDLDKTEDNYLTLEEFERLRCEINSDPEVVLRWAFNKFDTNNDGTIDKDELKKLLATVYDDSEGEWVDDEFVNDCLVLADGNNDGVLQIEEFVDMLIQRTTGKN